MRHRASKTMHLMIALAVVLTTAAATPAKEDRVKVAVLAFDTYLVESNWQFAWDSSRLGPLATSLLTKELTRHDRFDVIERRYIEEIMQEQDFGRSGRVDMSTAARLGQLLGAEIVVVGDVEHFGASTKGAKLRLWKIPGKLGLSQRKVKVELGARFVDASTGKVLGVGEGVANVKSNGMDALIQGNAIDMGNDFEEEASKVLREAVEKLGADLAARATGIEPTPGLTCAEGLVAAVDDAKVYLAIEFGSVERGSYFEIRDPKKPIPDPQNPEKVLAFVEESVGLVRVLEVQDSVTITEVVHGSGFAPNQKARIDGGPDHPDLQCYRPRHTASTNHSGDEDAAGGANSQVESDAQPVVAHGNLPGGEEGPDSADISTRGSAPRAQTDSPVGLWRLDVNETTRYWMRSLAQHFFAGAMAEDWIRESENDEQFQEWRDGLRALHLRLEIGGDGTFYLEMKDPATGGLSTVDGTWEELGLQLALTGTALDGIVEEDPQRQMLKSGKGGRLYGTHRTWSEGQQVALPWLSGWAAQWPSVHGAVFAREDIAQH